MKISLVPYAAPALAGTGAASCAVVSGIGALHALRGVRGLPFQFVDQNAVAARIKAFHSEYNPAYGGDPTWTCEALRYMGLLVDWMVLPVRYEDEFPCLWSIRYALSNRWPCALTMLVNSSIYGGGLLTIPTQGGSFMAHEVTLLGIDDDAQECVGQNHMGVGNGPIRLSFEYFRRVPTRSPQLWISGVVAYKQVPDAPGYKRRSYHELRGAIMNTLASMVGGSVTLGQLETVFTAANEIGADMADQKTINSVINNLTYLLPPDTLPTTPPAPPSTPPAPPPIPTPPPPVPPPTPTPIRAVIRHLAAGVAGTSGDGSVSFTGTWSQSSVVGDDGAPSLYSGVNSINGPAGTSYTFTSKPLPAGKYRVSLWFANNANSDASGVPYRGDAVPWTVNGITKVFNERTGGNKWVVHSEVTLAADERIVVSTNNSAGLPGGIAGVGTVLIEAL